jgi:hypothetical protein
VREMEACWPSSVGLRGRALNHPVLRWLKTVVVSDQGKGVASIASGGDREDVPEVLGRRDLVERALLRRRKGLDGIEIEGPASSLEMSLAGARVLARRCPAWRRREPGLRLLHGT